MNVERLVQSAMQQYGFSDYQATFIRHNENITYSIVDCQTQRHYLLRIHQPISLNLWGIQHTFEGLLSEFAFLVALQEATDLGLQHPVANTHGSFVTTIYDSDDGKAILCTLLTWVEGETLSKLEIEMEKPVRQMAAVAAEMHCFSQQWQHPFPLTRPVYDTRKYHHLVDCIGYGVEKKVFAPEQYDIIRETMAQITTVLAPLMYLPEYWGIIHADLGPGNVVVNGDRVTPIDFSFSGYGYYLFDLGGAAAALKPQLRQTYLDAYQRANPIRDADWRVVESCFLLSVFGAYGFHISNPSRHEWIGRRLPIVAREYCQRFMRGEPFMHL
ncbi:MAG: phosphotransferase enzyme family protein [Bacillota bacterium]